MRRHNWRDCVYVYHEGYVARRCKYEAVVRDLLMLLDLSCI